MKKLGQVLAKYKIWLLAFLKPLGFWGLGGLAAIDAAAIPFPLDLVLAGYIWEDKSHFYFYVLISAIGSAVGGLVPFLLGRAGGELFLMKRVDRRRYEKLRDRFERQEFLAMMIPSILPPPTPWKLFVFGAGVFEMRLGTFMLAVFMGRVVRNLITAALTIEYGPRIVTVTADLVTAHRRALLVVLVALAGALLAWVLLKLRKKTGVRSPGISSSAASSPGGRDQESGVRKQ